MHRFVLKIPKYERNFIRLNKYSVTKSSCQICISVTVRTQNVTFFTGWSTMLAIDALC
jgi:hypothetical protein